MSYTTKIQLDNAAADERELGVRLGRLCISSDIAAASVADALGVSKSVVYKWFRGSKIGKHLKAKVEAYYDQLLAAKT
jgi:hypothetical protein